MRVLSDDPPKIRDGIFNKNKGIGCFFKPVKKDKARMRMNKTVRGVNVHKIIFAVLVSITSSSALAWTTPKEAVEKLVEFDFNGNRLSSDGWAEYLENYLHAPDGYDEPGWDTVIVIDSFSVGEPVCLSEICTVVVTYQLHPTKSLNSLPVVPHENGGSESKEFVVKNKNGSWKVDPKSDYPRISYEKYKQLK